MGVLHMVIISGVALDSQEPLAVCRYNPDMDAATEFRLQSETITLGQLLKAVDEITSGGEVKTYLATHTVVVNGIPDQRRGRKLVAGDVVELASGKAVRLC